MANNIYDELWQRLVPVYGGDEGEAKAVVRLVLEEAFGLTLADIIGGKVDEMTQGDRERLEAMMARLEKGEPVQYVMGYTYFYKRRFDVAPGVLIPRPETEELCRLVLADNNLPFCGLRPPVPLRVLDVGTGSGCIAVTLALGLLVADVTAWDISGDALLQARENARHLGATVNLELQDALDPPKDDRQWDIIVSNPPYVAEDERQEMDARVLNFEPSEALFVPTDDPLRFYRAIARYAKATLDKGGVVYFEINPRFADEMLTMMAEEGFPAARLVKDQFGKQRFCKAYAN